MVAANQSNASSASASPKLLRFWLCTAPLATRASLGVDHLVRVETTAGQVLLGLYVDEQDRPSLVSHTGQPPHGISGQLAELAHAALTASDVPHYCGRDASEDIALEALDTVVVDVCPRCDRPAHASETNDHGLHAECASW